MGVAYTGRIPDETGKTPTLRSCAAALRSIFSHGTTHITIPNSLPIGADGDRMSLLRLPLAVYRELRAHGEEAFPKECCGALLGRHFAAGWQVDSLVRAANARAESPHDRYEIAPAELVKIAHEARSRGIEIAGFYHSHPGHPARWSTTDLEEAHWLGCVTVITEVMKGNAKDTNAFLLAGTAEEDKHFIPQTIQIDEVGTDESPA
jgi:proteasome lid subunit RPN8/RPN11